MKKKSKRPSEKKMMAKKVPKRSFLQKWGSYPNETLVCVGLSHEEIVKKLKAIGAKKDIVESYEKEKAGIVAQTSGCSGYFQKHDGASILWLREWHWGSWGNVETLVHELHHAVDFVIGQDRSMEHEYEAKAYQMEYLFREIRRKLNEPWGK